MGKFPFQILGVEHIGIATEDDSLNKFFLNILGIDNPVVETVENSATEITFEEGKKRDAEARLGDYFYDLDYITTSLLY